MSTQAIGAAAAGTAILGGGGVTIAYAAGAFDPKVKESKQVQSTYKTLAEEELKESKEYVGGNKEKIQTLLTTESKKTAYQAALKNVWEKMRNTVTDTSVGTQPIEADISDGNKASSVADYVNKWCQHVSNLSLSAVPTTTPDLDKWNAFKEVCFVEKAAAPNVEA
ncbi:hypothetical protein [Candidatus Mycoplasma haematohominis]|uniref:Uncharacterized protein n=1 Tax=Candidatus Mycoplasma haematohominis TaxID=1494318 RepID=A0A478FTP8_9MOLU|nr:hypothetical protein [Candidatus Mycoplasma haemohominis]GCE63716.1 hypothetical protein MHSWG343_07160 [Candidatus Mycoplasma haemohominis]